MNHRSFIIAVCLTFLPAIVRADTVLEFMVKKSQASAATPQSVAIKDGRIMVKAAGGDASTDLLYSQAEDSVTIVDHGERTVMTVNEAQVGRINEQAEGVEPLLQGLGAQIAKLSPEERRKWQEIIGDSVSLEKIAKGTEAPEPIRLVALGAAKVAGVKCQKTVVREGAAPLAELCLAEAAAIRIPPSDYATIRALLALYERLAQRSQKLARRMGLAVPVITMGKVKGVPILLRDLSRDEHGTLTLSRIKTAPVPPGRMSIPAGYAAKPLALW